MGLGGGSAIDTAKAVAGLITNGGPVTDYLEGVGKGRVIEKPTIPFIAVPVTAGTGAEATKNAVISSLKYGYKKSFRDDRLMARVALVDPLLTLNVSKKQTAYSGMDAITQLIESYVSKKSNPVTDALAERGLKAAAVSIKKAYDDGQDISAREGMCFASLLSGICLANSGLGAAHGFAAGLGSIIGIPHGLACAVLLPYVMKANLLSSLEKYAILGRIMTQSDEPNDEAAALMGVEFIQSINDYMGIPRDFKDMNITAEQKVKIAEASFGSSMSGNPLEVTKETAFKFIYGLF